MESRSRKPTVKSREQKDGTKEKKEKDNFGEWITLQLNVFVIGIVHSLSLHKTIPILVNDKASARLTLQILGTNAALLLGSIYFFSKAVEPLLDSMKGNLNIEDTAAGGLDLTKDSSTDRMVWFMYQSLWLLPICGLCYGCSMAWYQDLADSTYRYLQGVPKSTSLTKSVGQALYGTLVWLSAFIQVKLLAALIPLLCVQLAGGVDILFSGWTAAAMAVGTAGAADNEIVSFSTTLVVLGSSIALGIKHSLQLWIKAFALLSRTAGLSLMCLMYGWYGFDPKWIAAGLDPDERFGILERHWAYFMGFGLPYVVLMETTPFFTGYGIFLGLFPFCIMLGSVCNFTEPYSQYSSSVVQPLPIFKMAQVWTLYVIRLIDQKAYQAHKLKVKSDDKNSSNTNASTAAAAAKAKKTS